MINSFSTGCGCIYERSPDGKYACTMGCNDHPTKRKQLWSGGALLSFVGAPPVHECEFSADELRTILDVAHRTGATVVRFPMAAVGNKPEDKAGVRRMPEVTTRAETVGTRPEVYPVQKDNCGTCGQTKLIDEVCEHGATRYEAPGRHTLCDRELGYITDLLHAEHVDALLRRRTVVKEMGAKDPARAQALAHLDKQESQARLMLAKVRKMKGVNQ